MVRYVIEVEDFNLYTIVVLMAMTFCTFLAVAIFAMMVRYIQELNLKMKNTLFENMKLLDGMHEGLLILSEAR